MTQREIDSERKTKELVGILSLDVSTLSRIEIRVFKDGTAYALNGFGGRYEKFSETNIWDYDAAGGVLQYSHADQQYSEINELLTSVWKLL
jgi:hypothetical protein